MELSDWRINWQEQYLFNRTLILSEVLTTDHEHCEFCYQKFTREEKRKGYLTLDKVYVICDRCFNDFKSDFKFKIFNNIDFNNRKISEILMSETTEFVTKTQVYSYKHIVNMLHTIRSVKISPERIVLIPCIVVVDVNESPKIIELSNQRICFMISEVDELINEFQGLNFGEKDLPANQVLCFKIKTETGDGFVDT